MNTTDTKTIHVIATLTVITSKEFHKTCDVRSVRIVENVVTTEYSGTQYDRTEIIMENVFG